MNILEDNTEKLKNMVNRYNEYGQDLEGIISEAKSSAVREVVSRGAIMNPMPYQNELYGYDTAKGRILKKPSKSDECMRYSLDGLDRPVMVENYSTFLGKFEIRELYVYGSDGLTDRLRISGGSLAVLDEFDNAFSNTQLCLSFAGENGYSAEEYIYEGGILTEIITTWGKDLHNAATETHEFTYRKGRLVRIRKIWENGESELEYATKRPDFRKIRKKTYDLARGMISGHGSDFTAFGIDGFLGDLRPTLYMNITDEANPRYQIFQWENEEVPLELYDYFFTEKQYEKCIMMVAEIIIELAGEGLLKDKRVYFQICSGCATVLYPEVKKVLDEAGIEVW